MYKIKNPYYLFLLFVILFQSCSSNEEPVNEPSKTYNDYIQRKWYKYSIQVNDGAEYINLSYCPNRDYNEFVNNTFKDFKYTASPYCTLELNREGTFSINNNILKITTNGEVENYTIVVLNNEKLEYFNYGIWNGENAKLMYKFVAN